MVGMLRVGLLRPGAGLLALVLVVSCVTADKRNTADDGEPPPKAAPSTPVQRNPVPDVTGQLPRPAADQDINQAAIDVIKRVETLQLTAYQGLQHLLIGYGHAGEDVRAGMTITAAEAERLLRADLQTCETAVERTVTRPLTNNQFSAMVSLCFNIGEGAFARSHVARHFNAGNDRAAADAFLHWRKSAGEVRKSLAQRRAFERQLFLADAQMTVGNPAQPPAQPFAAGTRLTVANPIQEPTVTESVQAFAAMVPEPVRRPVKTYSLASLRPALAPDKAQSSPEKTR